LLWSGRVFRTTVRAILTSVLVGRMVIGNLGARRKGLVLILVAVIRIGS
jgi:hypothetical protein